MFTLSPLPYAANALVPYLSEETVQLHHGKHHATYVQNLNQLLQGDPLLQTSLEEVIQATAADPQRVGVFNNAAQVWNHDFYWKCMQPKGGGEPQGAFRAAVIQAFGSVQACVDAFKEAARTQFGSGWAWLVQDAERSLRIVKTGNADTPLAHRQTPLCTVDVWEHAYYVDYRNRRVEYLDIFFERLISWEYVGACWSACQ